ncbi:helix-turn-helix domain-containing protein [Cohnella yongneupensis]|uniref:Helix-turn-helix domain-containing protein n=1 Tax=Cohnella yongneupensis TaxID=425006 RepID=A0ABW0R0G0_9BACL
MFGLVSCGYRYVHAEGITIDRPNGAGNYAFVFFKNKSEVVLNGKSTIADGDTYILFSPSTPQYYRESELPFINDWFHLEGEGIAEFLSDIHFPLDTLVPAIDPLLITRSIMELQRVLRIGGPLGNRIIDAEIRNLFMKLSHLHEMPLPPDRQGRYYRQLSELRDEFYHSPHYHSTVENLALRVNLSKSYFQHVYKELFGCSVVADKINGRLEYAKYLLMNSTLSVSAIARRCGYEHDTHFMRQFKKFVGVTPGQFKSGA